MGNFVKFLTNYQPSISIISIMQKFSKCFLNLASFRKIRLKWKTYINYAKFCIDIFPDGRSTVIHQLMIHHHPMIHFCNINNFLRNVYSFMKQIFLDTWTYSPSTVKIWQGLNKFQAVCFIQNWLFYRLSQKLTHHLMI